MKSLIISLVRLIIVTLLLAYIFTKLPNASTMTWQVFLITEACAFILALVLMKRVKKEKIETLPSTNKEKIKIIA